MQLIRDDYGESKGTAISKHSIISWLQMTFWCWTETNRMSFDDQILPCWDFHKQNMVIVFTDF